MVLNMESQIDDLLTKFGNLVAWFFFTDPPPPAPPLSRPSFPQYTKHTTTSKGLKMKRPSSPLTHHHHSNDKDAHHDHHRSVKWEDNSRHTGGLPLSSPLRDTHMFIVQPDGTLKSHSQNKKKENEVDDGHLEMVVPVSVGAGDVGNDGGGGGESMTPVEEEEEDDAEGGQRLWESGRVMAWTLLVELVMAWGPELCYLSSSSSTVFVLALMVILGVCVIMLLHQCAISPRCVSAVASYTLTVLSAAAILAVTSHPVYLSYEYLAKKIIIRNYEEYRHPALHMVMSSTSLIIMTCVVRGLYTLYLSPSSSSPP